MDVDGAGILLLFSSEGVVALAIGDSRAAPSAFLRPPFLFVQKRVFLYFPLINTKTHFTLALTQLGAFDSPCVIKV